MTAGNWVLKHYDDFIVVDEDESAAEVYATCEETETSFVLVETEDEEGIVLYGGLSLGLVDADGTVGQHLVDRDHLVVVHVEGTHELEPSKQLLAFIEPDLQGRNEWAEITSVGVWNDAVRSGEDDLFEEEIVVNVESPANVMAGEEFAVAVSLDVVAYDDAAVAKMVGASDEVFDCMLSTYGAASVLTSRTQRLRLDGNGVPSGCTFRILAGSEQVHAMVRLFRSNGMLAAKVQVDIQIGDRSSEHPTIETSTVSKPQLPEQPLPDSVLIVNHSESDVGSILEFRGKRSPDTELRELGERNIGAVPQESVDQIFTELAHVGTAAEDTPDREVALIGIGDELFTLLAEDARTFLFEVVQGDDTLLIQTEEPWIPWEMMRISGIGEEGEDAKELGWLCELIDVARSTGEVSPSLSLGTVGLIRVKDSGLAAAERDAAAVKGLTSRGSTVHELTARSAPLRDELMNTEYSLLHFVGHGKKQTGRKIERVSLLLDGKSPLSPRMLGPTVSQNIERGNTFVFLNTCNAGAGAVELGVLAGWGQAFLNAGAGGFLGCHWAVNDQRAAAFAECFYRAIAQNTVAHAVRLAREEVREAGEASWLSYTLMADPTARFE